MNTEQNARIEAALASCLAECRSQDRPCTRVTEFISGLRAEADWTSDEIIELQLRVIRVLLLRGGRPQ